MTKYIFIYMAKRGRPPKPKKDLASKRIIFRLRKDLWADISNEAQKQGRTLSNMLVKIISERYNGQQ